MLRPTSPLVSRGGAGPFAVNQRDNPALWRHSRASEPRPPATFAGDRRAVARYAGLTGAPDESGSKRREKGLARAGNARVRRGMIQLAWRFLMFQKESALVQWYRSRTADARQGARKSLIVAMARKLLIELWRFVKTGETLVGVAMRPA